tara:strand:- start:596 stop:2359 length:1764 start_codon:yes stop_codon:yes gene_type:complete
MHTVNINDRQYTSWSLVSENETNDPPPEGFNPLNHKLFHGDQIDVQLNDMYSIIHSPLRQNQNIPGVLILENNRTYGRTENKKRLLYKCRPYDPQYPDFLIPYNIIMGFHKKFQNKYVTFKFDHWKSEDKHPYGILSQTIGDVHHLPSFYEYQLYCYELHNSITPASQYCKKKLLDKTFESYVEHIETHAELYGEILIINRNDIFTVDPQGCADRDDAISITRMPLCLENNPTETNYTITVYIANVWLWAEVFDIWKYMDTRVSTVYLPDIKRPMLPSVIADGLCSLDEHKERFAFAMEFTVHQTETHTSIKTIPKVFQCKIKVQHNFNYEEPKLIKNMHYKRLHNVTCDLDCSVKDSHDVVAFWMIKMNSHMATLMRIQQFGIYRTVQQKTPIMINDNVSQSQCELTPTTKMFVQGWEQKMHGKYVVYDTEDGIQDFSHEMMGVSEYVHITSPIRRLVDLLNQILWIQNVVQPLKMRQEPQIFIQEQLMKIDELNKTMKIIKKIQSNCEMLDKVTRDPELTNCVLSAIVLSKVDDNKYSIYIEKLQWMTFVYTINEPIVIYSTVNCKIYVFEREDQMRRKIRVQLV